MDWEVSAEDVGQVLRRHGVEPTDYLVDWTLDDLERITAAATLGWNLTAQVEAALSTIEDVLMENRIIFGDKRFSPPIRQDY